MSTATEILTRIAEAEQRLDPMRKLLDHMAQRMFRQVLDTKAPLIKYGRRKRRYRRMFPADIAARRVTFDDAGAIARDYLKTKAER